MKILKDSKGFTLAEMLIVMAVVVVLAAAALPKIGSVIEGAKESNDVAAISAAYTEAYTKAAMKIAGGNSSPTVGAKANMTQETAGWNYVAAPKIGGMTNAIAYTPAASEGEVELAFAFSGTSMADIALTGVTKSGS